MDASLLSWLLLIGAPMLALAYAYIEYQAYLLRTNVKEMPGGLRFTAHDFTVEAQRHDSLLRFTCRNAQFRVQSLKGEELQSHIGPMDVSLPAAGMRIQVAQIVLNPDPDVPPVATGFSRIVFSTTDELLAAAKGKTGEQRSSLQIDRVPDSVAKAFRGFAAGLEVWIDKLERSLMADIAARKAQAAKEAAEEAAELAAAQKMASTATTATGVAPVDASAASDKGPTRPLSPAEQQAKANAQLARWRQAAGFSGTMTEMRFDATGEIESLIDLNPDGRIILQADNRHFHGSLEGGAATLLAQELELMVRDDYWQEGDTRMPTFRLLKGAPRATLALWRNRLGEAMERFQVDPGSKQNDGNGL